MIDHSYALMVVRKDPRQIRILLPEDRTEDVCLEAVRQDGQQLFYVPEGIQTREMIFAAVQSENGVILSHVDIYKVTKEDIALMCLQGYLVRGFAQTMFGMREEVDKRLSMTMETSSIVW